MVWKEVKHLGHELASIWGTEVAGSSFTCYTIVPTPYYIFEIYFEILLLPLCYLKVWCLISMYFGIFPALFLLLGLNFIVI